jgi:hypothetical protein
MLVLYLEILHIKEKLKNCECLHEAGQCHRPLS